ncbi:hypothetical protein DERP_010446 [Dermatophagoides pteronyssinus]|uniref:Uncharacterized protein n=1 Tax=Dermatophagoides pteronyssinus TaxID=6956 RepID=A0ABQ8J545_DERPT|nr:hypothetical protein DERP_010446 [Dermatophagoides pteronyssinus]
MEKSIHYLISYFFDYREFKQQQKKISYKPFTIYLFEYPVVMIVWAFDMTQNMLKQQQQQQQ